MVRLLFFPKKMQHFKTLSFLLKISNRAVVKQVPKLQFVFPINRVNITSNRFCSNEKVLPQSVENELSILQNESVSPQSVENESSVLQKQSVSPQSLENESSVLQKESVPPQSLENESSVLQKESVPPQSLENESSVPQKESVPPQSLENESSVLQKESVPPQSLENESSVLQKESVPPQSTEDDFSMFQPVENIDLSDYGPRISPRFNFAMYADKSPVIQKLVDLGVNLYEIQKRPEEAQYLVTLNLKKIDSYIHFLKNIGVPEDEFGRFFTKNPLIFKEDLDDLQVRVNYLLSKKFDQDMIVEIVTKNPKWLSTPVKVIDEKLGYLQGTFHLKGDAVRKMVVHTPSIALLSRKKIMENIFVLKEEMGLDKYALKKLVITEPSLLRINMYDLVSTYEYLTKTMKVPMNLVLDQPFALLCRKFHLKERHKYLQYLGRAQYCNLLPGYVNLSDLILLKDEEFCNKIAKTPVDLFYEFLKTL